MKKLFYSIFVLGGLLCSACTQDTQDEQAGEAKLIVDLGADLSFSGTSAGTAANGTAKRLIDESAYTNIGNYTVTLTKTSDNTVVHQALYNEWNLAYMVEPNTEYKLTAAYGTESPASYDNLLVSGSETFTVQPGATKMVSFRCVPKAAKVNVVYSDDFATYYSDCEVSIKTKHITGDAWMMNKECVGKDLYLKADEEGEPVILTFNLLDKNGASIIPEGFTTTKTVTVMPKTLLKLTFKPNVTEIEGGKVGLNITVDTGVQDENINIEIPNDVFTKTTSL